MFGKALHNRWARLGMGILGVLLMAISINLFVVPHNLYTGGLLGFCQLTRSVLTQRLGLDPGFDISGVLYLLLNIPLLILAWKTMGRGFVVRTMVCTVCCSLFLTMIPVPSHPIVEDTLTSCLLGGMVNGFAGGVVLTCGCSSGGFDILGLYMSKKGKGFTVGKFSISCNAVLYALCLVLFDAATAIEFLRNHDLTDVFKLNLEGNHANLAGHTYQHEIRVARESGFLGSLDANQGDKLIGWDMDEFPTDLYETVAVMWEVLQAGSIGPHGGLNFDAKPRRTSFYEEDLFRSHIAGMDTYAAGLLVADKMNQDGFIQDLMAERYSSYDSGIGKDIDEGNVTLADLEAYSLDKPQSELIAATKSDHLESVKATINNYIIDALSEVE